MVENVKRRKSMAHHQSWRVRINIFDDCPAALRTFAVGSQAQMLLIEKEDLSQRNQTDRIDIRCLYF
jgi:hypothetical protein